MNKEEELLRKRLMELSDMTYQRGIVTFSNFLNINELHILHTTPKNLFLSQYETYGGYELSERQMVAFLPDALYYEYQFPVGILEIRPAHPKFAEELTHRDYLGALMNLGIERSRMGDIIVEENRAIVFVEETLLSYVAAELTRIRHTTVTVSSCPVDDFHYEPAFETVKGSVASIRLDTVLSVVCPMSRSKLTGLIQEGRVFVNGRLMTSNGYQLKEGDIISVRKIGRFVYEGILGGTKKGRHFISVRRYI